MRNSSFIKEDESVFEKIDKILKKSQCCYIYGKTTLAFEYVYYIKDRYDKYFVHLIVSGDEMTNLNELASRFLGLKFGHKFGKERKTKSRKVSETD